MREVADLLGINLGTLIQMRVPGARLYDPSFPPMTNQTFDAAQVHAYKKLRDERSAPAPSTTVLPIAAPAAEAPVGGDIERRGLIYDRRRT